MQFLTPYIAGWPILLPTFLALGALSIYQTRRQSEWWALQLTLVWLVACIYTYVTADVGRFLAFATLRWLFMVATVLLATAAPAFLVVTLACHRRVRSRRLTEHLGIVGLGALIGVPLAGLIASWMFRAFHGVA